MSFAGSVWRLLVAIKDLLALIVLLGFFFLLYGLLSGRPNAAAVREGALLVDLNGAVVEEPAVVNPLAALTSARAPTRQFRARDVVRALDAARDDARIRAVVVNLDGFTGGGQVSMEEVGAAMERVRKGGKPVLVHAVMMDDDALYLAAHGSEVWLDPLGGAVPTGPGGTSQYYKGLADRLKVNVHVFRVGKFKSAVEPFLRNDASPEAKEQLNAVYGALWENWRNGVHAARPQADLAKVTDGLVAASQAAGGDLARMALDAKLVDRLGDSTAFGQRVAQLVGADAGSTAGEFRRTRMDAWLASLPDASGGTAIPVITIAGTIVDGNAGPGTAGGDRIARLLDRAAAKRPPALVVRIDSPGGSVLASERIRSAIARIKGQGVPVVVSMGNLAASGGYWVSTPGSTVFAEPSTITGSIGIFAVIPTFEHTLAQWGVTSDGVRTTPQSGQPDVLGGITPEVEQLLQLEINNGYARFLSLVGQARHMEPAAVDRIAQGRIWDAGTARQIGLVDRFGGLNDALAEAAREAHLATWHPVFLADPVSPLQQFLTGLVSDGDDDDANTRASDLAGYAAQQSQAALARAVDEVEEMLGGRSGMQAMCLECPPTAAVNAPSAQSLFVRFLRLTGVAG